MRIVMTLLFLVHGLIHFMGFAKAYNLGTMEQFTKDISKPMGILWLLAGILFLLSTILHFIKRDAWPVYAIIAVILSQVLILIFWKDAKFGTIPNVIILIFAALNWASTSFEETYQKDVVAAMNSIPVSHNTITQKDLEGLPSPVQRYLDYVGVVGKPKVESFKIIFEGEMRDKGKDWFKFTSEQHSFIENPTRLFFMKAKISGIPTTGYHRYTKEGASMLIKLMSLVPVAKVDGPEMLPTETVTFFNDLCLFAPSALLDNRIKWETLDGKTVKATFTTNNTSISAVLYFNEEGELVNFISNDRYEVSQMKTLPFSTPISNYQEINGYRLPTYGDATWHYPDGEFVYGRFHLKSIEYNVNALP